jgi:hypothetical protein
MIRDQGQRTAQIAIGEQGTNNVHTVDVLTLCMQLQAFADPAVMKTFRRVEMCQRSLQSLMMRKGIIIPAVRTKSFSKGGPDADAMEEAITKFLDGMEGQERSGFKDLHRFLGRLPCPTVENLKVGRSM